MKKKEGQTDQYYRTLTRNLLLAVIIVSFAPMILVSGVILYQFNLSHKANVNAQLGELVLKHKQSIDYFLQEKLGDVQYLAKTFNFEKLSDKVFLQNSLATLHDVQFVSRTMSFQPFSESVFIYNGLEVAQPELNNPVIVDLGVVNSTGVQVAYAGPFSLGMANYSLSDWFQKAMRSDVYISDVFLGLRGLPHFIIAVKESWEGQSWILRATVDFVAFNNLVENIQIGKTGFAFILNREGNFQTKPLIDIQGDRALYMELLKETENEEKKGVHIVEKVDSSGNRNIYVSALLKNGDWLLVCQQKASDAFSAITKTLKIALFIILMGGLGIVVMALIVARMMIGRVSHIDQEKEFMNEQIIRTGKLASVGELAAGIAHEINNPVAIMVEEAGWIGDLLEEEEFQESANLAEFHRAVEQIRTQGKRCKEITHKLLSFARHTDSKTQNIQINELIEEIVSLTLQRAKYGTVDIKTHLQKNLPYIEASQTELQQVFLNLINNALDAMEKDGGEINISTYIEDDDALTVEIKDNGPGIPEANLERIFDPFFTTKPVGKGTGLGLSICYGIIEKMGGEIKVQSGVNAGSTFWVKIPI